IRYFHVTGVQTCALPIFRQMWMGGPKLVEEKGDKIYIESKHFYINHMDPLETVTTLFHRKIGEVDKEHKNFIGATLCSWPDRARSEERRVGRECRSRWAA